MSWSGAVSPYFDFMRVGPGGIRVSDIGRRVGLNNATAIRYGRALLDERFVLNDPVSGMQRGPVGAEPVGITRPATTPMPKATATFDQK